MTLMRDYDGQNISQIYLWCLVSNIQWLFIIAEYSDEEEEEFGIDEVTALTTGKIGTKKLRRIQAKAEKKAQREV